MDIRYPNEGMPKLSPMRFGPWLLPLILLFLAFAATSSLFYQVDQDEEGVVQRFGKYVRTTTPGLHMKLPFGIEIVTNVPVKHVFNEEFGYRTLQPGVRTIYAGREASPAQGTMRMSREFQGGMDPYLEESLMLTGDLNIAVVEWIVQYLIKDPVQYAFNVRDSQETIRNMSEAVMRLVVGDHTINEVLTKGRVEIQHEAKKMLQDLLDDYNAGIEVRNVILQDVTPPNEVKASFNEVNQALQEKEKMINQARQEYNRVIPRAKGEAEQQILEAEGYAQERTNKAKGDAERFLLAWEEYRKAPLVTKKRLYLEMTAKLYPEIGEKIIIDESQKSLLPLWNLNPKKEGDQS